MQNQPNINNEIKKEKRILKNLKNAQYLDEVCKLLPILLIKTQFGIGRYIFEKLAYNNDELVLIFKLSNDNKSVISYKITYYLGNQFLVSADQYLYAYRWYAIA